jgi:hypothetical protein
MGKARHARGVTKTQVARRTGAVLLATGALLGGTMGAYADELHDSLVGASTSTFEEGGSTTIEYYLGASGSDSCNVDASHPATVTMPTISGLTFTPASFQLSDCGGGSDHNGANVVVTGTAGTYNVQPSVSGGLPGNDGYNTNPGKITLTVTEPASTPDTTAPVITYVTSPAGPNGTNDWFTSDVTVTWTVTDPESAITSTTGCDPVTISTETTGTTLTCQATSAGGTNSVTTSTIKLDKTAPTGVAVTPSGTLGNNGWYVSDVTLTTTGTETVSAPATCTGLQSLTSDSTGSTFYGTCTNDAGLTSGQASATVKRDATAPHDITFSGIADGGSYWANQVGSMTPTCSATDDTSGLASCTLGALDASQGTHSVTATATDNAGNSSTRTISYTVHVLTFGGFYAPVDKAPYLNSLKAGQSVPLKLNIYVDGVSQSDTSLVQGFTAYMLSCSQSFPTDAVEVTNTGATSLRYDATGGQFIQNWKTPSTKGCYTARVTFVDGQYIAANFQLNK